MDFLKQSDFEFKTLQSSYYSYFGVEGFNSLVFIAESFHFPSTVTFHLSWPDTSAANRAARCLSQRFSSSYMLSQMKDKKGIIPLSPRNDHHHISPCNVNASLIREVMRINNMITNEFSWYLNNFSLLLYKNGMEIRKEHLHFKICD